MPKIRPPSICPMSTAGFRDFPQSYTMSEDRMCISPDSTSSSTSVTQAAYTKYWKGCPFGLSTGENHPSAFKDTSQGIEAIISAHFCPSFLYGAKRLFSSTQAFSAAWTVASLPPISKFVRKHADDERLTINLSYLIRQCSRHWQPYQWN